MAGQRNAACFSTGARLTIFAHATIRKKPHQVSALKTIRRTKFTSLASTRDERADEEPNP
jgi:hypothetical protein